MTIEQTNRTVAKQKFYQKEHHMVRALMKSKHIPVLFLLVTCVFLLFTGCTINVNIDAPANNTTSETAANNSSDSPSSVSGYQSKATLLISTCNSDNPSISSSDLVVSKELVEKCAGILRSNSIQNKLHEEYPGAEYELTLEPISETGVFAITATSKNPEKLEEICNMAASLFCEEVPSALEGVSCTIVDSATSAQQIGRN